MKKVLGTMSQFIGGIFSLAVLALLMSLTYGALQRIFPGNFTNQMWGLVMFDIAAMCWALIFVFQSKSVGQYASAGIGFLVGFIGTLGMVAAEVILSGQDLAQIDTGEIGKWMIYGFIIVTALHAALVYIHHGTAPEIAEQINVGVARGEVVSQAISNAAKTIEAEKQELSQAIYHDIVSQVKRDLGMAPVEGTVFDRRRTYEQAIPSPVQATQTKPAAFSLANLLPFSWAKSKPKAETQEQPDQAGAPDNYGPQWKASTDVSPELNDYAWVCLNCDGHNRSHTPKCQWCQQPRTNGSPVTAFADIPPIPQPAEADAQKAEALAQAKAMGMWNPNDPNDSPFERSRPDVHKALTQAAKAKQEEAKPATDNPFPGRKD